ncbi:MAG TPA: FAD-dependent oxidoreductase [Gaiellaceae bacterium]|nr:FAD-dependent oxidoreductase [Gaiellaceae bacterium]
MTAKSRIVVLGGGFAGLESTFLLRSRLGDRADLTLVSDSPNFLFKPNTIYIPFGADPSSLLIPLERPARKRDIRLVRGSVEGLDVDARRVRAGGQDLPYDFLVIATGSAMSPGEIPGLAEHAETIWTSEQMQSLGSRLQELLARAKRGEESTVLFAVPPGNKCAGPLYEIVLMTETWLRRQGARDAVRLRWTTFEDTYIQAFGPKLDEVVSAEFAARGIDGARSVRLESVEAAEARFADGAVEAFDLLVAFPPYTAAVRYDGLQADERGFLRTEPGSRRVAGQVRIYAPGDAGDFPVKQAFLAFLQADAAAEAIAAEVTGAAAAAGFDPVSMCVMEEFDKATFAQVPLTVTGDPERPVAVRAGADGDYRVGVSKSWRAGKKLLGLYLPLRFRNGLPFHSGLPWRMMDVGLKGMSTVLARR